MRAKRLGDTHKHPHLRLTRGRKDDRGLKREALQFEHDAIARVHKVLVQMESLPSGLIPIVFDGGSCAHTRFFQDFFRQCLSGAINKLNGLSAFPGRRHT